MWFTPITPLYFLAWLHERVASKIKVAHWRDWFDKVRMARNQSVQMTQTDGWCHVPEIELDVLGAIHCNADQAWILRLAGSGVDEMYVPAELDVLQQRI